jgi:hypothetical protein
MSQNLGDIRRLLVRALRRQRISWSALEDHASQVILFGSRAAGIAGIDSDWDLLCVGEGTCVHNGKIDLIWIPPIELATERWLGSELASHVAAYGLWLVGEDSWSHLASISPEAVHHKRQLILCQLSELKRLWSNIIPGWRAKHLRRIRRNVQRLHFLVGKRAVPPTPMLDDLWEQSGMPLEELEFLLNEMLRIAPTTK